MDKIIGMGNALVDVLVRIDDDSLLEKLHLPKGSMQLIQEDTLSEIRKYTSGMKIHRSTGGSAGIRSVHWPHWEPIPDLSER